MRLTSDTGFHPQLCDNTNFFHVVNAWYISLDYSCLSRINQERSTTTPKTKKPQFHWGFSRFLIG